MATKDGDDGLVSVGDEASAPATDVGGLKKKAKLPLGGIRELLRDALSDIATSLVGIARGGNVPALKSLMDLADREEQAEKDANALIVVEVHRCKSLEEMLMQDWRKEPLDE